MTDKQIEEEQKQEFEEEISEQLNDFTLDYEEFCRVVVDYIKDKFNIDHYDFTKYIDYIKENDNISKNIFRDVLSDSKFTELYNISHLKEGKTRRIQARWCLQVIVLALLVCSDFIHLKKELKILTGANNSTLILNIKRYIPLLKLINPDLNVSRWLPKERSPRYTYSMIKKLVEELNDLFTEFDQISTQEGISKIKTIGDSYMAAGGLKDPSANHAIQCIDWSKQVLKYLKKRNEYSGIKWEIRIGIHTGSSIGGIIGKENKTFDLWGDTINIASRLEKQSLPNKINVSAYTYELIKDNCECEYRGKIDIKGKGSIDMYFVK